MEKGNTAEIPGLGAGDYQVEFYDTKTGKILEKSTVTAEGETLTLLLPGFSGDLAVKLKPKEKDTLWKSIDFPRPKKVPEQSFYRMGQSFPLVGQAFAEKKRNTGLFTSRLQGISGFPLKSEALPTWASVWRQA